MGRIEYRGYEVDGVTLKVTKTYNYSLDDSGEIDYGTEEYDGDDAESWHVWAYNPNGNREIELTFIEFPTAKEIGEAIGKIVKRKERNG